MVPVLVAVYPHSQIPDPSLYEFVIMNEDFSKGLA